ncbi:hypothetical protein [Iamia sp.]|uniref:hypothetical protein n=1 Tax=Iamia sp. TaxID=2722710 RepID=UPI002C80E05A|nr:hypothetical protein [Iamia sp.]HXH58904.1 hypothetical protein [Iamia sp.]
MTEQEVSHFGGGHFGRVDFEVHVRKRPCPLAEVLMGRSEEFGSRRDGVWPTTRVAEDALQGDLERRTKQEVMDERVCRRCREE